jgi:hypothetical protein
MKTKFLAGAYFLTKKNGEKIKVVLTQTEARMMFKLFNQLGFTEINHINYN